MPATAAHYAAVTAISDTTIIRARDQIASMISSADNERELAVSLLALLLLDADGCSDSCTAIMPAISNDSASFGVALTISQASRSPAAAN